MKKRYQMPQVEVNTMHAQMALCAGSAGTQINVNSSLIEDTKIE